MTAIQWAPIAWTTVSGLAARAVANIAGAHVIGVAAIANATTAAALTELLGGLVDQACSSPAKARAASVHDVLPCGARRSSVAERARSIARSWTAAVPAK